MPDKTPSQAFDPAKAFDLTDRVAIITGGSRGLGREMALAFARCGARVVVASRKLDACEALAKEIREDIGREAIGVACHVGHWQDCDDLISSVYDTFGRIDVLVNNAGMSPLYPSLTEVSEELFDKVLGVNLKGPFRLSALAATRMAEAEGGSIINVSSVAAVAPGANELPYAAAKAGLHTLTIGMARAYGPKVRVNCIMPGAFMTDISKAWNQEVFARAAEQNIPMKRGGQPEEIVGAALYLASGASSYTTGAVLKIDGGAVFTPG
jgi:NAD(P)-dependent dehydrogenase (short-subunit alcohol dehydrogenase family)